MDQITETYSCNLKFESPLIWTSLEDIDRRLSLDDTSPISTLPRVPALERNHRSAPERIIRSADDWPQTTTEPELPIMKIPTVTLTTIIERENNPIASSGISRRSKPIKKWNYKCGECARTYLSKEKYLKHINKHPVFKCPHEGCEASFPEKFRLKQHLPIHLKPEE